MMNTDTKSSSTDLKIIVHRGTHEVGGNCVELEYSGERLILDTGLPLFDSERKPLERIPIRKLSLSETIELGLVPHVPGLFDDTKPTPNAIVLSHAHMDHVGLIQLSQPSIPIYATSGTSKMMLAGSLFAGQLRLPPKRMRRLTAESPEEIGSFLVTPFPVDHSIYGCVALLIEVAGRRILYSGDLRMHGRKPSMHKRLIEVCRENPIDVLLMEGTHFGFADGDPATEYELEAKLLEVVQRSPSLVLASFSPQHVDRLVAFMRTAIKSERNLIVDVYTAFVLYALGSEVSLPFFDDSRRIRLFVPHEHDERKLILIKRLFETADPYRIETEEILSSPSQFLMVFRPSMLAAFNGTLPNRTCCVYSRWAGYLDTDEWKLMRQAINDVGGEIVQLHTSGHILSADIGKFVNGISPRALVPIHTFEPDRFHDVHSNVIVAKDGVPLTFN